MASGRESGCGLLPAKSVWLLLAASQTLCLPHPKVGKTVLHQLPKTASIPSFSPGSGLRTQRLASGTKAFIYIFPCSLWNPTFPPLAAIQQIVAVAGLPPSACLQLLGADRAPPSILRSRRDSIADLDYAISSFRVFFSYRGAGLARSAEVGGRGKAPSVPRRQNLS